MRATCGDKACMAARMSTVVMNGPSELQASAALGVVEADAIDALTGGAARRVSESNCNSGTPGSVAGGSVGSGTRPNTSHAPAPTFNASSSRNSKRTNIIPSNAAVVESQAMDGRSETSETRSYKDSMASNVAAIMGDRKIMQARAARH